jgi:hypothetical protein
MMGVFRRVRARQVSTGTPSKKLRPTNSQRASTTLALRSHDIGQVEEDAPRGVGHKNVGDEPAGAPPPMSATHGSAPKS